MVLGKKQGAAMLIFGLLLLTGAILVLITVPSWGNWIADYPAQAAQVAQAISPSSGILCRELVNPRCACYHFCRDYLSREAKR
jgi:hypothetical protein